MITKEVSLEQIENWKKVYFENKNKLIANKISGKDLDHYFTEKYHPTQNAPHPFVDAVFLNAKENGEPNPNVSAYMLEGNVYVGIDLNSGFFQVECENIGIMESIWNDLFLTRGLSKEDIENFVIAAQYILLQNS